MHRRRILGEYDFTIGKVFLRDDLAPETSRSVLLHELVHAVAFHASVDLEEREVDALANTLFGLIRDNPGLVAYLTEIDDDGSDACSS